MKNVKRLWPCLLLLPFFIGIMGYMEAGETPADAIYYSIQLYYMEWTGARNVWLEIARWTAPLVTAAGILTVIHRVYHYFRVRLICLHKDSTVIYGRSEAGQRLKEGIAHSVLEEAKPLKSGKEHIIMFADDIETLSFFRRYRQEFAGKKVYLCLKELDSNLLADSVTFDEGAEVRFFNIHDVIARQYWKTLRLWEHPDEHQRMHIVIWGFGSLGQRILYYAMLLNLFSIKQQICYHILGESRLYETAHEAFLTMNGDRIQFHGTESEEWLAVLEQADRVILTGLPQIELLQTILCRFPRVQVDYYSPGDENIEALLQVKMLHAFGKDSSIYSADNIKTDILYKAAKELNHFYMIQYGQEQAAQDEESQMEEQWNRLDGFTKGSNISAADYREVIRELKKDSRYGEQELAELEHIRWCRYHFLNHWKYGIPEDGKNKDSAKKIHRCLCPFAQLPPEEQQKNLLVVRGETF